MTSSAPRRRDAAGSRERLLSAAEHLFADRGYDRTTIRDIGERAGVDPALIARYFGSKSALFLATLYANRDPADQPPVNLVDPESVEAMLNRANSTRTTPLLQSIIRPHADPDLQQAASALLRDRVLAAAEATAEDSASADSVLRAQVAVAAMAGVVLSRKAGALSELAEASAADLAALLVELFSAVLHSGEDAET